MKILSILLVILALLGVALATDTAITAVTTLDGQNDYAVGPTAQAAPTGNDYEHLRWDTGYLYFVAINTTACGTSPKLNIMAGDNPPAWRSMIGRLQYSLTNCSPMIVGPLESARFKNATGYLRINTTNVTTGQISVLKVLR